MLINLLLHYLKGKSVWIALILYMLILQAFVFCAVSYGVDAAITLQKDEEPTGRSVCVAK